jgi:hypothetical protein
MRDAKGLVLVAVGAIGAGCIGVTGVAAAVAASDAHGTIHGCVAKSDGALRIVKQAGACNSNEKPLSFNARGPRGLPGQQGLPGQSATSQTFEMFANVDAEGRLGSNIDAVSATESSIQQYGVQFSHPITNCAAQVQSGKSGGDDFSGPYTSIVNFDGTTGYVVAFINPANNQIVANQFMLTVTCPS